MDTIIITALQMRQLRARGFEPPDHRHAPAQPGRTAKQADAQVAVSLSQKPFPSESPGRMEETATRSCDCECFTPLSKDQL